MSAFEWIARPKLRDPIALLAFSGWGDAGDASGDAARFLVSEFEAETIGRFDSDPFIDFQVNRPVVSVDSDGVRSITWPTTEILVVHLPERDVVAVIGEEPNFNWKRFVSELCSILVELGVDKAISLGAFVGQVAHTVPVTVVGSSSSTRRVHAPGRLPLPLYGTYGDLGALYTAPGH